MKVPAAFVLCMCTIMSGCISINRGLEPVAPSYGPTWSAKVDTLTPRLEWMPYSDKSGKEDLRYQIQIFDGNVLKLYRDNIRATSYTVEEPLKPHTEYQWRVRPIWTVNGKTDGDQWNYKKYFFITPVLFGSGNRSYRFTTPEK